MHSKTKLKLSESNVLKRSLRGLRYVCGGAFPSYEPDENNEIFAKAYVRENLSCRTDIELTYYSTNIFPMYASTAEQSKILFQNQWKIIPDTERGHVVSCARYCEGKEKR